MAVTVLVGILEGCSMPLPSRLSASELKLVRSTRFAASVGVARTPENRWGSNAGRLVKRLLSTGLFERVDFEDQVVDPDLVARVRRTRNYANVFPWATLFTLGVVPMWTDEEWGEFFTLEEPGAGVPAVKIDFSYTGSTQMGWLGGLMGLAPGRTWFDPNVGDRYRLALSLAICKQAEAIRELVAHSRRGR